MKAKSLAKKDKEGRYVVIPSKMYPTWAQYIIEFLVEGERPPNNLRNIHSAAVSVGVEGFELAKLPYEECPADMLAVRAQALEVTRLWFTEQLHSEISYEFLHIKLPAEDEEGRPYRL